MGAPILFVRLVLSRTKRGRPKRKGEKKEMKRKKGFTIVELVIVIAVIAVLAAVLIPTFSSLIQKANLSSDQVAVRNMNNALAMDEAENGKPDDLLTAMLRMKENGYDFDSYKPLTEGYRFFWDQRENRVVLVRTEDMNIVYPEEMKGVIDESVAANYKSLYRDTAADREAVTKLNEKIAAASDKTLEITSGSELSALAAVVNGFYDEANGLEGYTVELPASINLETDIWVPIGEAAATPFCGTMKGAEGGSVITGLSSEGYTADIANAVTLASGQTGVAYGLVAFAENAVFENITLEDISVDLGDSGVEMGGLVGTATGSLTVKNCKIGKKEGDASLIRGRSKVGAFVGVLDRTESDYAVLFENCFNYARVEAVDTGDSVRAGGFVGAANFPYGSAFQVGCTFKDCENYGDVSSEKYAGGFIGHRYGGAALITFENCKSAGTVTGTEGCSGFYIGWVSEEGVHSFEACTMEENTAVSGTTLNQAFGTVVSQSTVRFGTSVYQKTADGWDVSVA